MQEFIKCLKAYIKNEKLNKIDNDKDLINLALEQSLQTILYPVYNDKSYKKYYIGWVVKQEEFLSIQNEITNIFNDNNINHLYFKGSVLCNLYDDISVRTRGDIDVYVDINDLDKAKSLLISNGYELEAGGEPHNITLYKNNIMIELHFALLDDSHPIKLINYYSKPFDIAHNVDNCLYALNDTEHFIYCLAHFAHHLRQGAGIRYMLDFYYMLKKTNIDYDKLHKDFELLGLSKLYNNTLNVIYYLTDEKFDEFDNTEIDYFIEYMLKSGIHGFGKENEGSTAQAVAHVDKKRYFMVKVFLTNKTYRKAIYPKLGSKAILYPLCLIKHWWYLLTNRLGSLFKFLFGKNKKKDLYNKLGI